MVVGHTGLGKSVIINTIFQTINQIFTENQQNQTFEDQFRFIKMFKLNPKSISINNLYGYVNLLTNEWNDGIAAKIIRDAAEEHSD